jgi:hypothetical protein
LNSEDRKDRDAVAGYRHSDTLQHHEASNGFDSNTRPGYIITETGFVQEQHSVATGSAPHECLRRLDPGLVRYPAAVQRA